MSINLIGISGKKGVGKDLVADIIKYLCAVKEEFPDQQTYSYEDFNYYIESSYYTNSKWKNVKFADKLKDVVCLLLNCTRKQLEDREFKESYLSSEWDKILVFTEGKKIGRERKQITYRELMQLLGTEVGRTIHPNIWINSTFTNYNEDSKWIISDVRFPNEANIIKSKGGILIRINRPGFEDTGEHESETALDNYDGFDYVIENDSSIDDLIHKIHNILINEEV